LIIVRTNENLLTGISYMPFGPASSYMFGNGLSHFMSFDTDYRVNAIQVGGVLSRNYNYDNADNIAGIVDAVSNTKSQTFTYDQLDRLTSANGIYGYQAFSYDAVGNRTGFLADNGAGILSDTYNYEINSNRLSSIDKTTAGVASGTRTFIYDAVGNRTQGTADDNKIQNYTYNNANRLSTAKVTNALVGTYSYSALGQRVKRMATTTELYQYDESGQLIAVTDVTGKTLREYIYNGNQLISFTNVSNIAAAPTVTLIAGDASLQNAALSIAQTGYSDPAGFIQFNGEGQAAWNVTVPAGGTNSITLRYSMVGANRQVTVWLDGVQKTAINFNATANWNSWSTTTTSQVLTAGTHTLTIKSNGNSAPNLDKITLAPPSTPTTTTYYVHNDHQGTPQVVTNQVKAVVFMANYQPFGKLNPGQTNSIELYSRFPGQYLDSETGLYYNYFRDYDPSIGRYIESDPIGLGGGINTYAYVEGNPVKSIDPKGLVKIHGNWCGPNWTGAKKEEYNPYQRDNYTKPIDNLDTACQVHDVCYYQCREDNPCNKGARAQCHLKCDSNLDSVASKTKGTQAWAISKAMERSDSREEPNNPIRCSEDCYKDQLPKSPPPISEQ
jgi:RHS repeat-associated protein